MKTARSHHFNRIDLNIDFSINPEFRYLTLRKIDILLRSWPFGAAAWEMTLHPLSAVHEQQFFHLINPAIINESRHFFLSKRFRLFVCCLICDSKFFQHFN
jgi:hypothetical protein